MALDRQINGIDLEFLTRTQQEIRLAPSCYRTLRHSALNCVTPKWPETDPDKSQGSAWVVWFCQIWRIPARGCERGHGRSLTSLPDTQVLPLNIQQLQNPLSRGWYTVTVHRHGYIPTNKRLWPNVGPTLKAVLGQTYRFVEILLTPMKWNESGHFCAQCIQAKLRQENLPRMVRWKRWHCPPDTGFESWRSEAEHATSRSQKLPTILSFTSGWGRKHCLFPSNSRDRETNPEL